MNSLCIPFCPAAFFIETHCARPAEMAVQRGEKMMRILYEAKNWSHI
jgi:hypothetical protein